MGMRSETQRLVHHLFGAEPLDNATLVSDEWDCLGLKAITVCMAIGKTATATSTPTVFTVHASDTASFSPGAGNLIATGVATGVTTARQIEAITITDLERLGRYVEVIVTVGNGSTTSDIACWGIGFPKGEDPSSATEAGLVAHTIT